MASKSLARSAVSSNRNPRRYVVLALVAVVAGAYAWAGVAMNASFIASAATAAAEANDRRAVYVFTGIFLLCAVTLVLAIAAWWRERRRSRPAI